MPHRSLVGLSSLSRLPNCRSVSILSPPSSGGVPRAVQRGRQPPRPRRGAPPTTRPRYGRGSRQPASRSGLPLPVSLDELDVQREALELLNEHVERLRRARLQEVLALDDGFVDPVPALH